ncbi:MAG: aminoacetone oxidase family FAD-binding enzyme [Chitinivibrionales bacterium]|nr:aminoacetone oxidase family FAD-binding enzyme [Chitinivibrionales bacterium]
MDMHIAIVGGGPAGVFAALARRELGPDIPVTLFEASDQPLRKVLLSGGGRCNLTNATFDPRALSECYPRGGKALIGPFSRFGPRETMAWFEAHGVALTVEDHGRVFPRSGRARSVVDCLSGEAIRLGVDMRCGQSIRRVVADESSGGFRVEPADSEAMHCTQVLLAMGGGPREGYSLAEELGHTVEPPVPSLFGLRLQDPSLVALAGLAVDDAQLTIAGTRLRSRGAVLITHEGLSGPAVLTLSSLAARELHHAGYEAELTICWLPRLSSEELHEQLASRRTTTPRAIVNATTVPPLPRRLWQLLVQRAGIADTLQWANLSSRHLRDLARMLTACRVQVTGRSVHKEEFVTCGGVRLGEVDLRTMQSRRRPGLFFAGELLDIDGPTGGYNLQAAWTTGRLAGQAMATQ